MFRLYLCRPDGINISSLYAIESGCKREIIDDFHTTGNITYHSIFNLVF